MKAISKMLRTSYLEFGAQRMVIGMVVDGRLRQIDWRDKIQPRYWPLIESLVAEAEAVIQNYK